jgi:hypothetical protein
VDGLLIQAGAVLTWRYRTVYSRDARWILRVFKTGGVFDMAPKKITATKPIRTVKGVRLDLSPSDHDRLERCAKERGLNMSSYARQAVLATIRGDEREERGV